MMVTQHLMKNKSYNIEANSLTKLAKHSEYMKFNSYNPIVQHPKK